MERKQKDQLHKSHILRSFIYNIYILYTYKYSQQEILK